MQAFIGVFGHKLDDKSMPCTDVICSIRIAEAVKIHNGKHLAGIDSAIVGLSLTYGRIMLTGL